MDVGVSVNNQMIGVLVKKVICGTLVRVIVSVRKHINLMNNQVLKMVLAKNV